MFNISIQNFTFLASVVHYCYQNDVQIHGGTMLLFCVTLYKKGTLTKVAFSSDVYTTHRFITLMKMESLKAHEAEL